MFENPDLMMFYSEQDPHSKRMKPVIEEFEKKNKTKIMKIEVWLNEGNKKELESIPEFQKFRGIPFFFNKMTKKFICGECDLKQLEEWSE